MQKELGNQLENWLGHQTPSVDWMAYDVQMELRSLLENWIQSGGRMVSRSPSVLRIPLESRSPLELRIQSEDRMASRRKGLNSLQQIASWTVTWRETQKRGVWMSWFVRPKPKD